MSDARYAIVGGGIVGLSIAYHLSRGSDAEVVVYERNEELGGETTARSGASFGWYGDAAQREMKRYGWRLYNEMLADPRSDAAPRYVHTGSLKLTTTEDGARLLRSMLDSESDTPVSKTMQGPEDDQITYLNGEEIKQTLFAPELDHEPVVGGVYRPNFGYAEPVALTYEFAARARDHGARFELGTEIRDVTVSEGKVSSIETPDERVAVDHVVCAAGPWNVAFADKVGIDLPVGHTLGPSLRVRARDAPATAPPLITHEESGAFCRRNPDGTYYLGHRPRNPDVVDPYNPDEVIDDVPDDLRDIIRENIGQLIPHLADAEVIDERVAVRSDVTDDRPIIGWTSVDGFSIAAFDSSGIQLAPATGRIVADQLLNDEPTEFYDAVSITRFDGYEDVSPW